MHESPFFFFIVVSLPQNQYGSYTPSLISLKVVILSIKKNLYVAHQISYACLSLQKYLQYHPMHSLSMESLMA